jgi:hypothetical protein
MESTLHGTGASIAILCALRHRSGQLAFVPFVRLVNEHPYDGLPPPITPDAAPSLAPLPPPSMPEGSRRTS